MDSPPLADVPKRTENLVACKVCGLVKNFEQFTTHGCENCPFLSLRGDRNRVEDCTTASFSGLMTTMEPHKSWASRWCHIGNMASGVYCLSVDEELPYDIREMLENRNISYRIRGESFYAGVET